MHSYKHLEPLDNKPSSEFYNAYITLKYHENVSFPLSWIIVQHFGLQFDII
jgi:hypothetical protein